MDDRSSTGPGRATMPLEPGAFPRSGVNSLASTASRGLARTLDVLVLGLPYVVVMSAVVAATVGTDPDDMSQLSSAQSWVLLLGPAISLAIVYETICVTLWGQTLGKLALGVRVARLANGRCPLWWESGLRIALPGAVAIIPHPAALAAALTLFVVAGFDPIRRSVPDRAAGTVVVCTR